MVFAGFRTRRPFRESSGCTYYEQDMLPIIWSRGYFFGARLATRIAIARLPDCEALQITYATELWRAGKFRPALKWAKRMCRRPNASAEAYRILGLCQIKYRKLDEALVSLNKAVELAPSDANICWIRGELLWDLGHIDAAEESLRKAVKLDPKDAQAAVILSDFLIETGQAEEGGRYAERAYKLDSSKVLAYVNHGYACGLLGRYDEAVKAYSLGVKRHPESQELRNLYESAKEAVAEHSE